MIWYDRPEEESVSFYGLLSRVAPQRDKIFLFHHVYEYISLLTDIHY